MKYEINVIKSNIQTVGYIRTLQRILAHVLDLLLDIVVYNHLTITPNRILFSSVPDYSDNAWALYDYMVKNKLNQKYELIWAVVDSKSYEMLTRMGIPCVKRYSIFPSFGKHRFWYYGKTAKWMFHTHGHPFGLNRKKGQIIVGLWHGGMGFKGPMGNSRGYATDDYILASGDGDISLSYVSKFQNCSKEILLPFGNPRNDLLVQTRSIEMFDSIHGIKILWMPTFRESDFQSFSSKTIESDTDLPILHTVSDVVVFNEYLTSIDVHIFTTNHPLRKTGAEIDINLSNIHTLNTSELNDNGIQLYEIFNHFSAMISDYSSVTFDFLYLDRPIAYTLDDFEEYKISRGFAMDNPLDYMPGHHVYTYGDLMEFVSDVVNGNDGFKEERERVRREVGLAEGGKASEMLLDFLGIK